MQLPIVDGFNGRERIAQDWMPKLEIDLGGMTKVSRFDRCRTCHAMIDAVDVGTAPAFPVGDWKRTATIRNRMRRILVLIFTSRRPAHIRCQNSVARSAMKDKDQGLDSRMRPTHRMIPCRWRNGHDRKHKWFDNHFWEHPMYPARFKESGCIKCHVNVVELGVNDKFGASAPKVFRGYQLVKTYGCFGCHDISGFDGTKLVGPDLRLEPSTPEEAEKIANDPLQVAGKMRKVGPSLRHSASKSDAGFVAYWTEEPKRFRPTTRMPQFFKLDNQHDLHLPHTNNPIEIAAIAHYLQFEIGTVRNAFARCRLQAGREPRARNCSPRAVASRAIRTAIAWNQRDLRPRTFED